MTQASPRSSTATRLVVSARRSGARSAATRPRADAAGDRGPGRLQRAQHVVEVVPAGEDVEVVQPCGGGPALDDLVRVQVGLRQGRSLRQDVEERIRVRPAVEAAGVVGEELVAAVVVGVAQGVARLQQVPVRAAVDEVAVADAHRRDDAGEQLGVGAGERCPVRGGEARRDHVGPRQPPPAVPQVQRPGGHARHGDGRRADLVRHALADEGDLDGRAGTRLALAQPGDRDEEVDTGDRARGRLVDGREAAAREAGEDRLGRAADQHHGDAGVDGTATRLEHRAPGGDRGLVPCGDPDRHGPGYAHEHTWKQQDATG
jgi:hypothetical protein